MTGVLIVFLDGVGVGPGDAEINPFVRAELPTLRALLGGTIPTLEETGLVVGSNPHRTAVALALDATMGVEGLPQSGTGQTALFTGRNAAREFGRHFGPWVPVGLRPLLQEEGLLQRARDAGRSTAFANAYPARWAEHRSARRPAAPPLMALSAGLLTRYAEELARGDAVASEIVTDGWRRHLGYDGPEVTAEEAGEHLGRISAGHQLTLYAHWATDTVGHRGTMPEAQGALERVDRFLGGVLRTLPDDHLLLVTSDHGNLEDVRVGHTRNPALTILAGPDAATRAGGLRTLMDVTPAVLDWLG